jgi:hypothetical protein
MANLNHFTPGFNPVLERHLALGHPKYSGEKFNQSSVGGAFYRWRSQPDFHRVAMQPNRFRLLRAGLYVQGKDKPLSATITAVPS